MYVPKVMEGFEKKQQLKWRNLNKTQATVYFKMNKIIEHND